MIYIVIIFIILYLFIFLFTNGKISYILQLILIIIGTIILLILKQPLDFISTFSVILLLEIYLNSEQFNSNSSTIQKEKENDSLF